MKEKLRAGIREYLDTLKLNQKLRHLFVLCVLIPMTITDVIILTSAYRSVAYDVESELEQTATSVEYALQKHLEYPANIAHNLYKSRVVDDFLNEQYVTPYDYYEAYFRLRGVSMFDASMGIEGARISMFADNPTILNGSGFFRMADYADQDWMKELFAGDETRRLMFEYGTGMESDTKNKRRVLLLLKMDMGVATGCKKALRLDLDFSDFEDELRKLEIEDKIYVCDKGNLIFTNYDSSGEQAPFEKSPVLDRISYKKEISLYGRKLAISIVSDQNEATVFLMRNGGMLLTLMALNIIMLFFMMAILERSVIHRIKYLENSFGLMEEGRMLRIAKTGGKDEIEGLIDSYNNMADRMNELMNTVYRDRLREQEMDIARQKAELLALHSQINPHFLFNVLESLRMHSLLKGEKETAEMVGKLAIMERTYVNWGDDEISIHKEMDFVKAYLALQKYRFGDRLSYSLEVSDDCANVTIPKLTIVTFVENACEHGVEKKAAPGWIFVRIFRREENVIIEVEDTGEGMSAAEAEEIRKRAEHVDIQSMQGKGHVGIMNAILRLQLVSDGESEFELESEEGMGTTVRITIPTGDEI